MNGGHFNFCLRFFSLYRELAFSFRSDCSVCRVVNLTIHVYFVSNVFL